MSISTNNENLQAILEAVNSLPEAGSGGGGSGNVETCEVTFVHEWGGNDDPELCRLGLLAYNFDPINKTSSPVIQYFTSAYDFLNQHTVQFSAIKNAPFMVLSSAISGFYERQYYDAVGGNISIVVNYEDLEIIRNSICYMCTPTEDTATFTIGSA